eukprot:4878702-Amphidinium_carterae.1
MNPTWNTNMINIEFIESFTSWRDEIYQYEEQTGQQINKQIKVTLLPLNKIRRQVQGHFTLKMIMRPVMKDPDYKRAMQTVEDDYRNSYLDKEQGNLNAFKGKYTKGKGSTHDESHGGYGSPNYRGQGKGMCTNMRGKP